MSQHTVYPVLSEAFLPTESGRVWIKRTALCVVGVLALWLSAKIQIASVPVPVTLQMLVIMVIGAAYGPRLGVATVAAYIMLGVKGVPVFAGTPENGVGLAYVLGPTGGYILGFLFAAYVVGILARAGWDRSFFLTACAMVVGMLCVYVPGVIWLATGVTLFGSGGEGAVTGYGWSNWYSYGVKTFIWVDALKLCIAVFAFPSMWRFVGHARL